MSKHTPGPWYWAEYYGDAGGKYRTLERSPVEVVIDGEYGASLSDEDARLIAAAPDLLEALDKAPSRGDFDNWDDFGDAYWKWLQEIARPALARAEGRS